MKDIFMPCDCAVSAVVQAATEAVRRPAPVRPTQLAIKQGCIYTRAI